MKYSLLFLLAFTTSVLFGQSVAPTFYHPNYNPTYKPGVPAHLLVGQMINLSNSSNYVTQTPGSFLDSISASSTVYFNIADAGTGTTFAAWPLYQNGTLDIVLNCTKISGTPDITGNLQESPDGNVWGPSTISYAPTSASSITGTVTTTYTPTTPEKFSMTNTTGVQSLAWHIPIKYAANYRAALTTTTVTQLSSCKVKYSLNY